MGLCVYRRSNLTCPPRCRPKQKRTTANKQQSKREPPTTGNSANDDFPLHVGGPVADLRRTLGESSLIHGTRTRGLDL